MTGQVFEAGQYGVALSPDGTRAVASRTDPRDMGKADLWLFDLSRGGSPTRFTFLSGLAVNFPIWSPDGKRIAFSYGGPGGIHLQQKPADSATEEELLLSVDDGLAAPRSWSPDGRFLLYGRTAGVLLWDLWVADVTGAVPLKRATIPFARTRFNEEDGRFSPDGRWIAYVSNESGTNEVYVRRFTDDFSGGSASTGGSVLISSRGGSAPRWRKDGKELYYLTPAGMMMSVAVTIGGEFRSGRPAALFQTAPNTIFGDVTADGKRFLLGLRGTAPFTVILNWIND